MNSKISLIDIIDLVSKLKDKIEKHKDLFQKNEMLVRYALIDPFLRVLGWDTEDPNQVEPEHNTDVGKPDYALKIEGLSKPIAFIEAKALDNQWDKVKLITYANPEGVPYVIATDGNKWEIYEVFKAVELEKKLIVSWQITKDQPAEIALKALSIANLANKELFGKKLEEHFIISEKTQEVPSEQTEKNKLIEGPINNKIARILILQVLAETNKPLRRKEIAKEISKMVKLTDQDKERTNSGKIRWESTVMWAISNLNDEGSIEKVGNHTYKITEKGYEELKKSIK